MLLVSKHAILVRFEKHITPKGLFSCKPVARITFVKRYITFKSRTQCLELRQILQFSNFEEMNHSNDRNYNVLKTGNGIFLTCPYSTFLSLCRSNPSLLHFARTSQASVSHTPWPPPYPAQFLRHRTGLWPLVCFWPARISSHSRVRYWVSGESPVLEGWRGNLQYIGHLATCTKYWPLPFRTCNRSEKISRLKKFDDCKIQNKCLCTGWNL